MKPKSLYQTIVGLLHVVMLAGLVVSLIEQQWFNAFLIVGVLVLTSLPMVMARHLHVYVPPEFELLAILFVFASVFLGEVGGYYARFWWWDVVLHTGSGFLLGTVGFLLVYVLNQQERIELYMKPAFVALFALAFAVAAGAVWEIFEFAMDSTFGLNMQKSGLRDTMWDLIVDTVGALVIALAGYAYMKQGRESFVFDAIERFIKRNPRLFEDADEHERA